MSNKSLVIILVGIIVIVSCIIWLATCTATGLFIMSSMLAYQVWDLIIKIGSVIIALYGSLVAYSKILDDKKKNIKDTERQLHENRLTYVYGPLFEMVSTSETVKEQKHRIEDGKLQLLTPVTIDGKRIPGEYVYKSDEIDKLLDGDEFIFKVEGQICYAPTELIDLFFQYKTLLRIKIMFPGNDIKKVNREIVKDKLFKAITDGYAETRKVLGLE